MRLRSTVSAVVMSAALVLVAVAAPSLSSPAYAVSASDFRAGNIISDQVFFDSGTMTQASIQSFLTAKEQGCTAAYGYPCLKDYTESTSSRAVSAGRCNGYNGAANEPASQIIDKVSKSCGINPQVLLVLLEKEQGLVSSTAPTAWKYQASTGYGCPDTSACDSQYYGFYNQVYRAAWQLKEYVVDPAYWRYRVGNVSIQFSPNAACGSSVVNIVNGATAALYNYTPYQPNQAALNNLYGPGDSCSAYGNRNFWVYFNSWFGASTAPAVPANPMASLDGAQVQYTDEDASLVVSGWVIDAARPTSTALVDVYVDQPDGTTKGYEFKADTNRPDVGAVYTTAGAYHGFAQKLPLSKPGSYRVCVFPMTGGSGWLLGCRNLVVPDPAALGALDSVVPSQEGTTVSVTARGWAFDQSLPAAATSVSLELTSPSGTATRVEGPASQDRPDVAALYSAAGGAHGYSLTVPVTATKPGTYEACVSATGHGLNGKVWVPIRCSSVTLGQSDPTGVLDYATLHADNADSAARIDFGGWALDRAWPATSIPVDIYLDKPNGSVAGVEVVADGQRPDIARLNAAAGSAHGFTGSFPVTQAGTYRACAFAIGRSVFGSGNSLVGCVTINVPQTSPTGALDSFGLTMSGTTPQLAASGWGMDMGSPSVSSPVDLYLDRPDGSSQGLRVTARDPRTDIARLFPGAGEPHGFSAAFPVSQRGTYRLCAYSIAVSRFSSANSMIGCKSFLLGGTVPTGALDYASVTGAGGHYAIGAGGWSADPSVPRTSIPVSLYLDLPDGTTRGIQVSAAGQRVDVGRAFPLFGAGHGFGASFAGLTEVGRYRLCAFGIAGSPFSGNSLLGCKTVDIG